MVIIFPHTNIHKYIKKNFNASIHLSINVINGISFFFVILESGMPTFGGRPDSDGMNDERIQHILTEASSMIQKPSPQNNHSNLNLPSSMKPISQIEDTHSIEDSKSPPNCTSPFSKRNMKKYENDDISEEKLQKIYQEEFQKLISRGQRDAFPK